MRYPRKFRGLGVASAFYEAVLAGTSCDDHARWAAAHAIEGVATPDGVCWAKVSTCPKSSDRGVVIFFNLATEVRSFEADPDGGELEPYTEKVELRTDVASVVNNCVHKVRA